MVEELSIVGKRYPRWAANDKVTGAAKYAIDIKLPGMLVGKVLTSPYAHAEILNIDTSKAKKLPGIEAVITFKDIPYKLFNTSKSSTILHHPEDEIKDMYVLTEKGRFVGDPIAAVAAIDAATAEEALQLIDVEYKILPAVFHPLEAIKPGAPLVHESAKNNISLHSVYPGCSGDVKKGFQEADFIAETTFQTSKQHMAQLEPCSCVASLDSSGKLTIWSNSQHLFLCRRKIAELFDIPEGMIRWINPHIGGGFGKNGSFGVEPICIALTLKTNKPVKIEYSREEDFFGTDTREAYIETGKIGVKKDGTMTALQEKVIVHSGAYFTHSSTTAVVNMSSFLGLYRCPNLFAELDAVYTNIPSSGGCRGYGNNEAMFLLEQLVDIAAEGIGMDPLEMRLKNVKKKGDLNQVGSPIETEIIEKCIRMGAEKFAWKEKRTRNKENNGAVRRGVGMAIFFDVSGAQPFNIQDRNVLIKLSEDGSASLVVGSCDIGQNLFGTISQIAAEVIGLKYEDIHVVTADTDISLFDIGQHANGGCYQLGNTVIKAATEIRGQILERAARKLGVPPEAMDIKDGEIFFRTAPEKRLTVAAISREAMYNHENQHSSISATGHFSPSLNPVPFGVVFSDIEVDTETGEVKIIKLLQIQDSGRMINPTTVEGQLQGGMLHGLGYTLFEDYYINEKTGTLVSNNYNTYKMPSSLDVPETELIILEEPVPSGPFGAKGVGMCGLIGIAPAIANAIYDAVGIRIKELPITPEKVLRALSN